MEPIPPWAGESPPRVAPEVLLYDDLWPRPPWGKAPSPPVEPEAILFDDVELAARLEELISPRVKPEDVPSPRVEPEVLLFDDHVSEVLLSDDHVPEVLPLDLEPTPKISISMAGIVRRVWVRRDTPGGKRRKDEPAAKGQHSGESQNRETKLERQIRQGEYRPPPPEPRPPRPPIQLPDPQMRLTPLMRDTLERVASVTATCDDRDPGEFAWPEPRRTQSVPPRRWQWTVSDTPITPPWPPKIHYAQRWVLRAFSSESGQERGSRAPLFPPLRGALRYGRI